MQRNVSMDPAVSIEALFDTLFEAVLLCDADLRVRHLNRAARELLGVSSAFACGRMETSEPVPGEVRLQPGQKCSSSVTLDLPTP